MTKTRPAPDAPKDFSRKRKRIAFTIEDEQFDAAVALPAEVFVDFATKFNKAEESEDWAENFGYLRDALELVLHDESFERFAVRLRDKEQPVELDQMADIIIWLLGEYGLRPTQPSSDSSDGQPNPDSSTSSTENSPAEESTSEPSLPIAS